MRRPSLGDNLTACGWSSGIPSGKYKTLPPRLKHNAQESVPNSISWVVHFTPPVSALIQVKDASNQKKKKKQSKATFKRGKKAVPKPAQTRGRAAALGGADSPPKELGYIVCC